MNSPPAALKAQLRRELRAARKALPDSFKRCAARRAAMHLLRVVPARARVGVYLASGSELDSTPLIAALRLAGCSVHLPCIDAHHAGRMHLVRVDASSPLRVRTYGLREPLDRRARAHRLDVLVLPLLGFDAHGTRLGSGAGYYDRWLAARRPRPYCVGYAYAMQQVDALPREAWDRPLDAICTERGLRRFSRR